MVFNAELIQLPGSYQVLLSHMSMLGLSMILEEELGVGTVQCAWSPGVEPKPQIKLEKAGIDDVASIVKKHATQHVEAAESWLHAANPAVGSLFSARTKDPANDEEWSSVLAQRAAVADELRGIDSDMTVGIGERSWWQFQGPKRRSERGASPWEMRTRNRGAEFVANTLFPLARAVSERSVCEIRDGLTGRTLRDEVGKDKAESRTATGFAPIGPTDNARAWVALCGISAVPMWKRSTDRSVASAAVPPRRGERGQLLMPMATDWVTVSRWKTALRSRALVDAFQSSTVAESSDAVVARALLGAWGFDHIMRFPVFVTDNPSAPERRTLRGVAVE